ncbi:hypothetical protein [Oceanobacillus senegalensis]|uniref:hypothetical protein n=1 Tax=Oceanobacillus senegalensis TaxID=1936063 RepID=UPI000A306359|nr:hypothetical protein [Oceanobacillus senegalensis]
MKRNRLFLLGLFVLPWLTIPLLKKNEFKKYLPAVIFIATVTKALDGFGENRKWWKFYKSIPFFKSINFFNLGPYVVSSFWMLKFTYDKLPLYLISNFILQFVFTFYGGLTFVQRYKIFSLEKMSKLQYLLSTFFRAIILYGFQSICDFSQNRNHNHT